MTVKEYILLNFDKSICIQLEDEGTRLKMPYPYTAPCVKGGHFVSLFYHDAYFINAGMLAADRVEVALNNVNNIAYLINRFGYMPNASNKTMLGRSQPPYFAMMVKDVFSVTGDKVWLKEMISAMEKEQKFWQEKRQTKNGLNRHFGDYTKEQYVSFSNYVKTRVNIDKARDDEEVGQHYFAEAESGWDFTARFNGYCADCNPIDLQCLLYFAEDFIAKAYEIIGEKQKGEHWQELARARKQKVDKLLFNNNVGLYVDYNYKTNEQSKIYSLAGFFPFFTGLADEERAKGMLKLLEFLETDFALSTAIQTKDKYQWGYENAWAPLHLVAVVSLDKYGYKEQAKQIARKYMCLIESNFQKTGKLFEKYNALTGGIDAVSEYGTPEMMGWTATVYLFMEKFLQE